jgi:hypothetical protein
MSKPNVASAAPTQRRLVNFAAPVVAFGKHQSSDRAASVPDPIASPVGRRLVNFTAPLIQFRKQRMSDRATGPSPMVFTQKPHQFSADAPDATELPIRIFARSIGPAIHPAYPGQTAYHDFAGMTLSRERLVIEWRHGDSIGYLDRYQFVPGVGLYVDGMLVLSGEQGDLARRVAQQLAKGVPLEASITTEPQELVEEVFAYRSAQVNNQLVQGPCGIIREWTLRGVAVCPYGADSATRAELVGATA